MKALPPAGSTLAPCKFAREFFTSEEAKLSNILQAYPNHTPYPFNNAKSAITTVLAAIRIISGKSTVAISAYTCPDVATAAIDANCKILLFDISSANLQPDITQIKNLISSHEIGSILYSNLYGFPDKQADHSEDSVFVINDLCQSALSSSSESAHHNLSEKEIGILSFGRGKAFAAVGGGLLLVPKVSKELEAQVKTLYEKLPVESQTKNILYGVKLILQYFLEKPSLYWLPLSLPFLKLGETKVRTDNTQCKAGTATRAAISASIKAIEERKAELDSCLELYRNEKNTEKLDLDKNITPIRLPLILSEEQKVALINIEKKAKKKGLSFSYPKAIHQYPEISPFIVNSPDDTMHQYKGSEKISQTIVTLPVHKYIKKDDIVEIFKLIPKE